MSLPPHFRFHLLLTLKLPLTFIERNTAVLLLFKKALQREFLVCCQLVTKPQMRYFLTEIFNRLIKPGKEKESNLLCHLIYQSNASLFSQNKKMKKREKGKSSFPPFSFISHPPFWYGNRLRLYKLKGSLWIGPRRENRECNVYQSLILFLVNFKESSMQKKMMVIYTWGYKFRAVSRSWCFLTLCLNSLFCWIPFGIGIQFQFQIALNHPSLYGILDRGCCPEKMRQIEWTWFGRNFNILWADLFIYYTH